jgi:hypothetical protein
MSTDAISCGTAGISTRSRALAGSPRASALPFVFAALLGVSACAVVDRFGERGVTYNLEAEKVQNDGLLLNVLRAAHRRPLQFTDLTTVTGLANASGTLGFSLPFDGDATAYSASPSVTLEGGPNFNIANLNTQEFYNGLLSPVPLQTIALYAKAGIPKAILFTLAFSALELEFDDATGLRVRKEYYNGGRKEDYELFKTALNALIDNGLDLEVVDNVERIGAPLSEDDVKDIAAVSDLDAEDLTLSRYDVANGDALLSEHERRSMERRGLGHYYVIERRTQSYRFCFDKVRRERSKLPLTFPGTARLEIPQDAFCASPLDVGRGDGGAKPESSVQPEQGRSILSLKAAADGRPDIALSIRLRSVQNIFYYLGEIARSQLGLDGGAPYVQTVLNEYEQEEQSLITVVEGNSKRSLAAATYLDETYSVPQLTAERDRSGQVMDILTQLLALLKSAEDLPAPSVIPVVQ